MTCTFPDCTAPVRYKLIGRCLAHRNDYFLNYVRPQATGSCIHCGVPLSSQGGRGRGVPKLRCEQHRAEFESVRQAAYRSIQSPDHPTAVKRRMADIAKVHRRRMDNLDQCVTTEQIVEILAHGSCVYCSTTESLTVDHVIPVIRGGLHEMDNLVCACRSCNSSKNDLTPDEWFASGRAGVPPHLRTTHPTSV